MLTLLITALRRLWAERRRRTKLRELLSNDDRLLEDIGLRRVEIIEALGLSHYENAREHAYRMSARSLALDARF